MAWLLTVDEVLTPTREFDLPCNDLVLRETRARIAKALEAGLEVERR
ncbi:MAG: hypothetical protein ACREI6_10195 [Candidatus Rokuibacteriota bacterium]